MPLVKSPSKEAFSANVSAERAAGKPMKQALAIAYSVKRRAGKYAEGGEVEEPGESYDPAQAALRPRIVVNYHQPRPVTKEEFPEEARPAQLSAKNKLARAVETKVPETREEAYAQRDWTKKAFGVQALGEDDDFINGMLFNPASWVASAKDHAEGAAAKADYAREKQPLTPGLAPALDPSSWFYRGPVGAQNPYMAPAQMDALLGGLDVANIAPLGGLTKLRKPASAVAKTLGAEQKNEPVAFAGMQNEHHLVMPGKEAKTPPPDFIDTAQAKMEPDHGLGTNPGRFGTINGQRYYFKHATDPEHARNEVLIGRMYSLAGVPSADLSLTKAANGKVGVASKAVKGVQLSEWEKANPDYSKLPGLHENLVVDAWLRNWDAVGIGPENHHGNVMVVDGKAMKIDPGGGGRFRGRGTLKDDQFGTADAIPDIHAMINTEKTDAFKGVSEEDLVKGAQKVANINPVELKQLFDRFGPSDPKTSQLMYERMLERRKSIMDHFRVKPKHGPEVAPSLEDEIAALVKKDVKPSPKTMDTEFGKATEINDPDDYWNSIMKETAADDIVAAKIPPMPKATMEPTTKKVSLAGGTINYAGGGEFLGKMGPNLYGLAKAGQLSAKDVKGLVGKLTKPSVDPIDAAGAIWDVAVVNPHSGEALFRALPNETKAFVGYMLKDFTSGGGGKSPFDNLTKVPGKFLFSHTSDPKFWGKPKAKKEKIKTAKDYTDKDIEDYYASMDEQASKEAGIAKGDPVLPKGKSAEIGETLNPWDSDLYPASEEWDKFLHVIPDFRKFKPDWEDLGKRVPTPNAENDPDKLGFHTLLRLFKGGSKSNPKELMNPPKGYHGEISNSLSDSSLIAKSYEKEGGISEYIAAPKKAMEVDWPKINGGSAEYSNHAMVKLLKAAKHRGADMVVVRNISDSGSHKLVTDANPWGLQTQYHVLDTSILRNPDAEFATRNLGKAWPMAGVAGGFLVVHGKDEGADKMKRGGGVGKLESALRVAKKYASGGPLDLMADKNDTNQFLPHTKGILASTVPGRTDKLPIKVKPGSYVIPADILSSSALGQGNTLAGSKMLDIGLAKHRGPRMGMFAGMGQHSMRSPAARAKSATPKLAQHSGQKRIPGMKQFAEGGEVDDGIPIIAAGGEYLVEPEVVQSIGGGDVQQGHDILDKFVKKVRAHNIKTLKALPGPKRS